MILLKTRARPRRKFTHELADDDNDKEKLKVIENIHPRDYYEDYDDEDNNMHIAVKKQRLKTGGLANSRGTNHQSVIHTVIGWQQSWLVATTFCPKIPVGDVYVNVCLCVGGGL
jgi:hypothetical protein